MRLFVLVMLAVSVASTQIRAEDVSFQVASVYAIGNSKLCSKKKISSTTFGGDLALVYDDVGLQHQQNASPNKKLVTSLCLIYGWFTVPKGYFVDTVHSSLNFGILKPTGVSVWLSSSFWFLTWFSLSDSVTVSKLYNDKTAVDEPLVNLSKEKKVSRLFKTVQCQSTTQRDYRVPVAIETNIVSGYFKASTPDMIVGLDTADYNFNLTGNLRPCTSIR